MRGIRRYPRHMATAGAFVRVQSGQYVVGLALVDGDQLLEEVSLSAPADRDEAGQLGELFGRVADTLVKWAPDHFALRASEINRSTGGAVTAHRAEGIVMGAAGRVRDLPVSTWRRASLFKPAGLDQSAKGPEVTDALCSRLSSEPVATEVRQAASAAVAADG